MPSSPPQKAGVPKPHDSKNFRRELARMPGRASQGPVGGHTVASFKCVTVFLHHVVVETDSVITGDPFCCNRTLQFSAEEKFI